MLDCNRSWFFYVKLLFLKEKQEFSGGAVVAEPLLYDVSLNPIKLLYQGKGVLGVFFRAVLGFVKQSAAMRPAISMANSGISRTLTLMSQIL